MALTHAEKAVDSAQFDLRKGKALLESSAHSFIIKLWLEKAPEEAQRTTWHGYITHVPTGERRYLKDLKEITAFITSYLQATGKKNGICRGVQLWFKRLVT